MLWTMEQGLLPCVLYTDAGASTSPIIGAVYAAVRFASIRRQ
jgi:hypothetical protein